MNALPHEPETETLDERAADWFARRRSGGLAEAELEAWLDQDPAHREAFERLERAWSGVESARDDPRIMILRERALKRSLRAPRAVAWRALAASLAVAVFCGGIAVGVQVLSNHGSLSTQAFRTGVGQQATVTLSDGSVVTLNTDTRLRTRAARGRRLVYLDQGQAYFRVAKDRVHPFVVAAGGRTVTAVGTAFDVRIDPRRFEVTLVEGKVRVEGPAPADPPAHGRPSPPRTQATEMAAGTQLSAPDDRHWSLSAADTARATSWLRGYLTFQAAPFGEVAAEMNRYSDRKIVVDDEALARTPVSGAFKAGDVDAFVRAFTAYKVARVESADAAAVRLGKM